MVTNLEQLRKIRTTEEAKLPPFVDGTPFTAELKKVSLIDMVKRGKVPNPILSAMMTVTGEDTKSKAKGESENGQNIAAAMNENTAETFAFMQAVAEECLVNPSYKDITENGVSLTDAQIMSIFSYAMSGTVTLSSFREDS